MAWLLTIAATASANVYVCDAEYTLEQCQQAGGNGVPQPGQPGGSNSCPYYLCSNSDPSVLPHYVWCESKQEWTDCPTISCYYQQCIGRDCAVRTTDSCSTCPENPGSNVRVAQCPRT